MILPSSKEEDKLLKKRYAVFNDDGSLAELKGFEVKRRGELQLIKTFQSQIFEKFLLGTTLKDCYAAVASVADKWLDVLFTKAASLPDDELVELIAENRSMSKTLAEYAGQKSTSISTARRLAEFLGEQMVRDKGLSCRFIISTKPHGAPVTERAVPVAIFSAEPSVKKHFLRKWLKDNSLDDFELRSILDWDYYIERLGSVIQKLITIPAALQKVTNPVPRIRHPDWLFRRVANLEDKFKQHKIDDMFARQKPAVRPEVELGDLEDYGRAAAKGAVAVVERSPSPPPRPPPSINADYPGWIAHMKPIWREKRKLVIAAKKAGFTAPTGALGSMLFQQTSFLSSQVWDILQISPVGDRPGEFKVWLLINDTLQSVRLKIEREFYVNFIDTAPKPWPKSATVEPVSRTLPRSQRALNLVKVRTTEAKYQDRHAEYSAILNDTNVDGVYEQDVPLIVRAFLRLGSSCVPDAARGASLNKGLDEGFVLADLKRTEASLSRRRYLDRGQRLRYVYLIHIHMDSRHVFGLFTPAGTARFWVVQRGNERGIGKVAEFYVEQLAKRKEPVEPGVFAYSAELAVEVSYHKKDEDAFKSISRELATVAGQRSTSSLLVIHSPKPRAFFDDALPAAATLPFLMIQSAPADNFLQAVGWQLPAVKRMVTHYLRAAVWIKERIELADRYDLPICNLEQDIPIFLADLDFARRLTKADALLWWTSAARPDLGGRQTDANSHQLFEDLHNPEIGRPGCYSNACLEVDIRNLAADAVLQSALVYELEGGEGGASIGFEAASHTLDEYSKGTAHAAVSLGDAVLPTQTFNIVRSMVKAWSSEAAKPGGEHWRLMIDHFWRWISSPTAKLYDPALYRFVHGLMRKTFSQLLAEFRRLGCEVVHADFGRVFLLTSKPSSASGYAYANYVVSSVTSRELFRYVQLDIVRFWDQLVWMDTANYAGVVCDRPDEIEVVDDLAEVEIEMHWNIASLLPPAVQDDFSTVVARFVHGMHAAKRQSIDSVRTPLRLLQNGSGTAADPTKLDEVELARTCISQLLTRQLLKLVSTLKERASEADPKDPDFHFPDLPGTHLKSTNVVLEFVKSTCAVLALAKDVGAEVLVLKRNLLDLIGVREFATEAAFRNPCLPFKVPMVVCRTCNIARGEFLFHCLL